MKKNKFKQNLIPVAALMLFTFFITLSCQQQPTAQTGKLKFGISFSTEQNAEPLDGRILLLISTDKSSEPRFQISDEPNTGMVFGINIDGLAPGEESVLDASVFGYPLKSIADMNQYRRISARRRKCFRC